MIISRAHDPDTFWGYVIILVGIGFAFLYLSRLPLPRGIADDDRAREVQPAAERPMLPNYDPVFCGKIMKGAAFVCAGLIVAELLFLLLVHPSDNRCPGWGVRLEVGMFTVLPALWMCYGALRWDDHYAGKMYDSIAYGPPEQMLMDVKWLILAVAASWCLFCAIPIFLMLGKCTTLKQYLSTFWVWQFTASVLSR